ncbi:MAG TPA: GAF domain-containing protein [Polyangiaceae bacterium]|nr:GAF domain-containing protein [Polyangiaceae bacterium]
MSILHIHPAPSSNSEAAESSQLGKAARLLDDAQRLLKRASDEADSRHQELARRIQDLEGTLAEMEQLLGRTERQASQLINLYVATYQLHASLETSDVRAAIADIAVNLLGAERFTILLKDDAGLLWPAPEGGAAQTTTTPAYPGGDALIDACLVQNSPQFGPRPGSEAMVAVPFVRNGEAVGVLVVEAFLRHKPGLEASDHELLDLMAAHAASALIAARAFHINQRKLNAYEGLLGFLRGGGS